MLFQDNVQNFELGVSKKFKIAKNMFPETHLLGKRRNFKNSLAGPTLCLKGLKPVFKRRFHRTAFLKIHRDIAGKVAGWSRVSARGLPAVSGQDPGGAGGAGGADWGLFRPRGREARSQQSALSPAHRGQGDERANTIPPSSQAAAKAGQGPARKAAPVVVVGGARPCHPLSVD